MVPELLCSHTGAPVFQKHVLCIVRTLRSTMNRQFFIMFATLELVNSRTLVLCELKHSQSLFRLSQFSVNKRWNAPEDRLIKHLKLFYSNRTSIPLSNFIKQDILELILNWLFFHSIPYRPNILKLSEMLFLKASYICCIH